MTIHLMLDLETLGTTPGSAILSIGAVKFVPATGEIGPETFYANVSLTSGLFAGLSIDPSTLAWWREQSQEARLALVEGDCLSLEDALQRFSDYACSSIYGAPTADPIVWCKGGSFDFPLLAAAYRACGLPLPWKFWNERCARTLFKCCREIHGYELPRHPGTAHSALEDALHQAQQVAACYQLMQPAAAGEPA